MIWFKLSHNSNWLEFCQAPKWIKKFSLQKNVLNCTELFCQAPKWLQKNVLNCTDVFYAACEVVGWEKLLYILIKMTEI